jgi:hypothetical protein
LVWVVLVVQVQVEAEVLVELQVVQAAAEVLVELPGLTNLNIFKKPLPQMQQRLFNSVKWII